MSNNEQQLKKIELRDLQPILSHTFGDQLVVVRYTTKNLLQPGENYGSTILSVHAVIKRDNEAKEEDLYLVAKMPPPTEFQRKIFSTPHSFRKEIFMYENIVPYYRELEREVGLTEDELFDILPKYYQSRLSLSPDVDFDDNAVILMENLKMRGYYTANRVTGCDHEQSKLAIRAMARFHALGMATKYKRPEYFEVLKKRSKCLEFKTDDFEHVYEEIMQKLADYPELAVHLDRCKAVVYLPVEEIWYAVPDEPWSTIVHADFWVNNVMFHDDENGQLDDVKFVDFQNYLFLSPLREIVLFLFSSTEVRDDYIEELIDLYHKTLLTVLDRMGCDIESFTREKLDARLLEEAKLEFVHVYFMLKIITMDVEETKFEYNKMKNFMLTYQGNDIFGQRLRKVALYFIKRNWI